METKTLNNISLYLHAEVQSSFDSFQCRGIESVWIALQAQSERTEEDGSILFSAHFNYAFQQEWDIVCAAARHCFLFVHINEH